LIPVYSEPYDVIEDSVKSVLENDYPFKENITVLLAVEERWDEAPDNAKKIIKTLARKTPVKIEMVLHPANLPGESKVK
jgi:cellulose synthase/poly-beta-1,6-N-acetylglucosamine synthase-like glycosyltransferase